MDALTINYTKDSKDKTFYVSYCFDTSNYGCTTTAIVIGNMEKFYILKGNHMKELESLNNLSACLEYYKNNADLIHPYSDKLDLN